MTVQAQLEALLDSLKDPILFVDADHVIRYINRAAVAHYKKGRPRIGRSIFDCHNERSCQIIRAAWVRLQVGEMEVLISENEERRIYQRGVRDEAGRLLGYYERYEPV